MSATSLSHFQSVFAHQFFVGPADQNYFLARFAKIYGMHTEFWWQSLQAIEKVLKATLVLNGRSVKNGYGHNIEKLWHEHLQTFGTLSVETLTKPEKLNGQLWKDQPLCEFISKMNRMGQPDCRYGLVSYSNSTDDLFKLDQLFYELRRRTIGLEWIVGSNWNDDFLRGFYGQPYRNVIEQLPHYQIREMNVPTGAFEVVGSNLEDIHFSWNCPFARTVQDIEKPAPTSVATTFPGSGNSYLFLLWNELNGKTITQETREQVSWLLDNVWVGKDAENEFRELLTNK